MKASDGRYRREATKTSGRVAVEKGSVRVARDPLLLPLLPLALLGCTCHSRSFEEPQTKEMILLDYIFVVVNTVAGCVPAKAQRFWQVCM